MDDLDSECAHWPRARPGHINFPVLSSVLGLNRQLAGSFKPAKAEYAVHS